MNQERHLKLLTQNAAVLGFANVFGRALMILLAIGLARQVGAVDYGQFSQAIAWTLVLGSVSNLGLERLLTRETARAPAQAGALVRQALALKLGATAVSIPLLIGLNASLGFQGQRTLLLYLMGTYHLFDSFRMFFSGVFEGTLHMARELWLMCAQAGAVFGLALLALWRGWGVVGVAWAHIVAGVLSLGWGGYLLAQIVPLRGPLDWRQAWALWKPSLPFGLYTLFSLLYYRMPTGLVGLWQGDAAAGWFNAAYVIVLNLSILPRSLLGSSFPLLAHDQHNARAAVGALGAQTIRYLTLIGLPLALQVYWGAPLIIRALYGPGYDHTVPILRMISVSIPFSFLDTFLEGMLGAVDRQGPCTVVRGGTLALFFISSGLLARAHGSVGVGVAFVLVEAVTCLLLGLLLARAIRWDTLTSALWKTGLASGGMLIGMQLASRTGLAAHLIGAGAYLVALWALRAFTPAEIELGRQLLRRTGYRWGLKHTS